MSQDQFFLAALGERALLDALTEGVVWQSADGSVVDANAAAAPILGLTRDELLGRTSRDPRWYAVHEDGSMWPGSDHPAMVTLRTGQRQQDKVIGIMAPGRGRRWLNVNSVPLGPVEANSAAGVVTTFKDITDQVELRHRLEQANAELADLYDHAPCGYHMLDAQGRYLRINDTELGWLGCTRDAAIGHLSPLDFMSGASRETFGTHFPRILAGERLEGLDLEMTGCDGRSRHLRLNAEPILDKHGQLKATRSVLHDITELKADQSARDHLASEQAAIIDNDLVGIVRLKGRDIIWTNRAFDHMFGYASSDLVGQTTQPLYADEQAYLEFGALAYPVLQSGGVYRSRLQLRRKDGRLVWVDCSGFMLQVGQQDAVWFSRDITDQHLAEELRVKEVQLAAEARQLHETTRLQGQFLSNMSHELRTPLNAVIGFAHLLKTRRTATDSQQQQHYLERIEASGKHLLAMIDALLETAAAERGRIAFQPRTFHPSTAIAEAVAMLQSKAVERSVHIEVDLDQEVAELRLDPLRLQQVLLNLVGNAIKFSWPGGSVAVRLAASGSERFRLEVEDHGIGIAPTELPRLFSKFRQGSSGHDKAYEGTGIGLAHVKFLVEAQGGAVEARSQLGVGSTFAVEMPRCFPSQPPGDAEPC